MILINPNASIINKGSITAQNGGLVALIAPTVKNNGVITAKLGTIQLGSADSFVLDTHGDGLVALKLSDQVAQQLIVNSGQLNAAGGNIALQEAAGNNVINSLVQVSGELNAPTIEQSKGKIIISTPTQANKQTQPEVKHTVELANATEQGDGGKVIVWADGHTFFAGNIEAKGTGQGNQGGLVETSGKVKLTIQDTARVTTANTGTQNGLWLLDPQDFNIGGANADISTATLQTNLTGGDVQILSSTGGTAGDGNIYVNENLAWNANRLTLTAANDVIVGHGATSGSPVVMAVTGTGALTVNTGSTNGADTGVSTGKLRMALSDSGFTGRVDYNSAGSLIINGDTYTIINSLGAEGSTTGTDLQGMNGDLTDNYALGSHIDASDT